MRFLEVFQRSTAWFWCYDFFEITDSFAIWNPLHVIKKRKRLKSSRDVKRRKVLSADQF